MIEQIIGKSKEIYGLFLGWDSDARAVMPQTNWSFHPIFFPKKKSTLLVGK